MRTLLAGAIMCVLPCLALAQGAPVVRIAPEIPVVGIVCPTTATDGSSFGVCSFGGGGGSGGANGAAGTTGTTAQYVQGVPGGTLVPTSDTALDALIAGGKLSVAVSAPTQVTEPGDAAVTVTASTSTSVWTTSTAARTLRIVPNNATCFMRSDGGTASATSTPIPGGYVFTLVEPPPTSNITVFCTTAANVAVSQGN